MGSDGNEISHEETNDSSIKTQNDANINLEESDDDTTGHDKDIVYDINSILCLLFLKEIHAFFSGEKG